MAKKFLSGIKTDYITVDDDPILPTDGTNKKYVDGITLTWKGPWNVGTSYVLNDLVQFDGSTYIYINTVSGQSDIPTSNGVSWELFGGTPKMRKEIDEIPGGDMYIGTALPGTGTSTGTWAIKRVQSGAGGDISITWANGNSQYDKVWDDRATYTYL